MFEVGGGSGGEPGGEFDGSFVLHTDLVEEKGDLGRDIVETFKCA